MCLHPGSRNMERQLDYMNRMVVHVHHTEIVSWFAQIFWQSLITRNFCFRHRSQDAEGLPRKTIPSPYGWPTLGREI
jgi:hypothetical protein